MQMRNGSLNAENPVGWLQAPEFSVVLAYSDFAAGQQAMDVYRDLVRKLGRRFAFRNALWPYFQIEADELRADALMEAAQAHMLVFAAESGSLPPAKVRQWIENWLAAPGRRTQAIVALALPDKEEGIEQEVLVGFLERVAARGAIDFLARTPDSPGTPVVNGSGGGGTGSRWTLPGPGTSRFRSM